MGRFPSGQREQTVNLPLLASVVRIHPCPHLAGMAELADAHDSGSCVRTYLQVQVLFPALKALRHNVSRLSFFSLHVIFPLL